MMMAQVRDSLPNLPTIYILDPSVEVTGAFICARTEAELLQDYARIAIALPNNSRIDANNLRPFFRVIRLPIVNVRKSLVALLLYFPALLVASWCLRRQMAEDKATCLQLNDFYLMHGVVCRLLGFTGRIVTWIRFDPQRFGLFLSSIWLNLARLSSDRLVAVSRFIQDSIPYGLETKLIYDTIPRGVCDAVRQQARKEGGPRMLVCIGNYIEGKGQDDVISAFAGIADHHLDLELHFHGSDMGLAQNRKYRMRLKAQAEALELANRIYFHGFAKKPEAVLGSAYAALNFSKSESFSMTCLEAGFHGVPVIATDSGGPREIIDDGSTGLLVPVGDVRAMRNALAQLADDPDLAKAMGRRAAKLTRSRFSQEKYVADIRDVFRI